MNDLWDHEPHGRVFFTDDIARYSAEMYIERLYDTQHLPDVAYDRLIAAAVKETLNTWAFYERKDLTFRQ